MVDNLEVKLTQNLHPACLSPVQQLSGIEVFELFMLSKDHNLLGYAHQKVSPFLKAVDYYYHFLIMNMVVKFGR